MSWPASEAYVGSLNLACSDLLVGPCTAITKKHVDITLTIALPFRTGDARHVGVLHRMVDAVVAIQSVSVPWRCTRVMNVS